MQILVMYWHFTTSKVINSQYIKYLCICIFWTNFIKYNSMFHLTIWKGHSSNRKLTFSFYITYQTKLYTAKQNWRNYSSDMIKNFKIEKNTKHSQFFLWNLVPHIISKLIICTVCLIIMLLTTSSWSKQFKVYVQSMYCFSSW